MEDHHWRVLRTVARRAAIVCALATLVLPAACDGEGDINDDPKAGTAQEQFDKLLRRPSFEEMTERYKQLVQEVRQVTIDVADLPAWEEPTGTAIGGARCGFDFPDIGADGGTRQINGGFSRANISDDLWPKVVEQVARVARKYGFERSEVVQDKPGNHQIYFYDSYGGDLGLGTQAATSMSISSGCFLKDDARQRGTSPEPGH